MRIVTTIAAGLACIGITLAALPAHAEEGDPTAGKGSIGALVGYGFKGGTNFGFGARGGYTLPANVYLGATFSYHLGQTVDGADTNLYYFGVEGGYDIALSPVVIRPYLGFGRAVASIDMPEDRSTGVTATKASPGYLGFWPGVTAIYPLGRFFVGLDARYLIVENFNAFSMFATGGILL